MRLRTDKRESSDASWVIDGTRDDFLYDAACAHALVMAMKEIDFDGFCTPVQATLLRAGELMREWGFGDEP